MEGITEIDKTEYIDECKEIVRNEIPEELSDEMLTIVTNEIMDTCLFIGGDFNELITKPCSSLKEYLEKEVPEYYEVTQPSVYNVIGKKGYRSRAL